MTNLSTQPLTFHPRRILNNNAGASPLIPVNELPQSIGALRLRELSKGSFVAISQSGDHTFISFAEAEALKSNPTSLPINMQADLQSRFFLDSRHSGRGTARLLSSRKAARRATISAGPSLHIIVPTLQCAHSCQYCQVSRSLEDQGHTMSLADLDAACDAIFLSPASTLTVEFQGGDPLLRFDLVQHAILRIEAKNRAESRAVRYVVASTLHQLTAEMCDFFRKHRVVLSTSVDGPAQLHNRNRPTRTRDAYEKTIAALQLAREKIGHHSVSALMTTTRASLDHPESIVDEYVRLGLPEIFIRPLSTYGFAKRNQGKLGYSVEEFANFYNRALDRVLWWNAQGTRLREVYASIIFNKMLSTFDAGYVDLQSPTGAGSSVLVYNYDGYVYPSDEARMLAEDGDASLRICRIADVHGSLAHHALVQDLQRASAPNKTAGCDTCAFHQFCGPNPIDARAQYGTMFAPVLSTEHCQRHMWLFDNMYRRLRDASDFQQDCFYEWARPTMNEETPCDA